MAGICGLALAGAVFFVSAADTISVKQARELLQHLGGANLPKDQVQIKKVTPGIGGGAIIEAQIESAFRVEKKKDGWHIAEVRLGDRQWESFELIEEAVTREKARRTTAMMKLMTDGLTAYQRERGQYVASQEIAGLLDVLSPRYLPVPTRFDLWGRQFEYKGSMASYRLTSVGADGKPGTMDDLVVENGVIKTATAVNN
ncbi:MAG: type II secretion system protein GspG [Acidobacteriota bacterium]|nr:type II secretion system protein GspG [Acidobacteriota bacterium]